MVLSLLVVSSYARFDMMVTKEEIESICTKENINHSLCFEILKPTAEANKNVRRQHNGCGFEDS
ncbi:unnamed protein product [Brassica oleracea]